MKNLENKQREPSVLELDAQMVFPHFELLYYLVFQNSPLNIIIVCSEKVGVSLNSIT